MKFDINMIVMFAIVILIVFLVFSRCTFKCGEKDDDQMMKLVDELQNLKEENGQIQEIDMDQLMELKKQSRLGLIEVNNDKKEYYYPYGLYSGYYNWRPYAYHQYSYPYRRYLRPYSSYYYPGRWYRHYGNYYYSW